MEESAPQPAPPARLTSLEECAAFAHELKKMADGLSESSAARAIPKPVRDEISKITGAFSQGLRILSYTLLDLAEAQKKREAARTGNN